MERRPSLAAVILSASFARRISANACANWCGDPDCSADGTVGVLLNNGDGTFPTLLTYYSGGYLGSSVAVADVSGDGKPDLLVANECYSHGTFSVGSVGVLLGNGDGTFQPAMKYSSGGRYDNSVAVADVNGDGKPDLLVANECGYTACINTQVGVLPVMATGPSKAW